MDLRYNEQYEAFRAEVSSFLEESWPLKGDEAELPPAEQASRFRSRAIERGYLARGIPKRYGGSEREADVLKSTIIREEFRKVRAPGDPAGIGPSMLAPTLLEKGEEWQKEKFVPPTIRGEMIWAQGYSEPGSGSDLASLQTRAELDGDEWVVNGQKIWTSGAQFAEYIFLLCRTEPEAGKHAGISYLLMPMRQEGIEVRPLRQMTGTADFNEVFFTDARTPADHIVGKRGEGWLVSRATLKHERNMIGSAEGTAAQLEGLVRLAASVQRGGRPAIQDPAVRQELARIEGHVVAHRYSGYRQLTLAARDQEPGPAGLMNKLVSTNLGQDIAKLALDLIGDVGLLAPTPANAMAGEGLGGWIGSYMWSLGIAIAGGTANVQRNVIAERGLGLPRDAAANRSH